MKKAQQKANDLAKVLEAKFPELAQAAKNNGCLQAELLRFMDWSRKNTFCAERPSEDGWVCRSREYGEWFLSREAVINDWKRDQKEAFGKVPDSVDNDTVDTWFHEQISWTEVAAYGVQLSRPDMASFERSFMQTMKGDTDWIEHCRVVRKRNGKGRVR